MPKIEHLRIRPQKFKLKKIIDFFLKSHMTGDARTKPLGLRPGRDQFSDHTVCGSLKYTESFQNSELMITENPSINPKPR